MLNPCISYFGKIPDDVKCGAYWQCEYCEYCENTKEGSQRSDFIWQRSPF